MARFLKNMQANKGQAPGSVVFIGKKKVENIRIRLIDFDQSILNEDELRDIAEGVKYTETDTVTWINVDGLHDVEVMKKIGNAFDLHPLLMEDVANTAQRPKMEEFDNCLFIVLKMLRYDREKHEVSAEQLSIVLGRHFLITFQEQTGDVFEPVRERIRKGKGRIRASGIDYLAYALLDTVVDNYIYLVSRLGEDIEELELEILSDTSAKTLENINDYKQEIAFLRKAVRPAKEFIARLPRLESEFLNEETKPFLNDLNDLATQAIETIDTYREMLSDQLNIYNSNVSNKMNDIMRILTIFAAIFIPLTFIAGIYGTNFEYLPELHFRYSYFIFWGVMIMVALSLLYYFKRKGWL